MKKIVSIAVVVALITTSIPPREVEASWFSDFCGGLFTIITAPIWIFCQDNPTFRKNNPFRKKAWEVEEEAQKNDYKQPHRLPINFDNTTPSPDEEPICQPTIHPKKSDNTIPDESEEPVLSETVSTEHKNYALVDPNPEDTVKGMLYVDLGLNGKLSDINYWDTKVAVFEFKLYKGIIVETKPRSINMVTDNHDYDKYGTDGYNKYGYNKDGYNKDGYNRRGVDKDGYGRDGFNRHGYNKYGYNKDGYNRRGEDKDGYGRDGYNADGFNRQGFRKADGKG